MRPGAFTFNGRWMKTVQRLPETGMGFTVVSVTLSDGRQFGQVVIDGGHLTRVRGRPDIPFGEEDIANITPTHEKWDWAEVP